MSYSAASVNCPPASCRERVDREIERSAYQLGDGLRAGRVGDDLVDLSVDPWTTETAGVPRRGRADLRRDLAGHDVELRRVDRCRSGGLLLDHRDGHRPVDLRLDLGARRMTGVSDMWFSRSAVGEASAADDAERQRVRAAVNPTRNPRGRRSGLVVK